MKYQTLKPNDKELNKIFATIDVILVINFQIVTK